MKRGTPDHPKMLDFAERLHSYLHGIGIALELDECQTMACGILERLWHFAGRYAPAGNVGKHSDAAIAAACGWRRDAATLTRLMVDSGWLDKNDEIRLFVHDWHLHSDEVADRYLADNGLTYANDVSPRQQPRKGTKGFNAKKTRRRRDTDATLTRESEPKPEPKPEPYPPPPTPSAIAAESEPVAVATRTTAAPGGGGGASWSSAEKAVRAAGVVDTAKAIEDAKARGVKPEHVLAIVSFYRSRDGDWGPAALRWRIGNAIPDDVPSEGWPKPETTQRDSVEKTKRLAERDREIAATKMIKLMQKSGKSDVEIQAALDAKGWVWP